MKYVVEEANGRHGDGTPAWEQKAVFSTWFAFVAEYSRAGSPLHYGHDKRVCAVAADGSERVVSWDDIHELWLWADSYRENPHKIMKKGALPWR